MEQEGRMGQGVNQDMAGSSPSGWRQADTGERYRRGISGSTLKMIAVISMFIDHFGAGVLSRYLSMAGLYSLDATNTAEVEQWMLQNGSLYKVYVAMRMIGRIAFPIYCFLLVEGFGHTRNRMKYAARLLVFAAVSELPFDLLFNGEILEFGYQNVFFTLFLGLAAMMGMEWAEEHLDVNKFFATAVSCAITVACMAAAQLFRTDYMAIGVLCIAVIYSTRKKKILQMIAGCAVFLWELTAPLAFVPIWFYNGKRGWKLKYFFYLFYPMHLLLLYLLCIGLGIVSYPAMG